MLILWFIGSRSFLFCSLFINYLSFLQALSDHFLTKTLLFIYLFFFSICIVWTSFSGSIALTRIPMTVLNRRWSEAFGLYFLILKGKTQFLAITYEVNYKSFVIFFIKIRTFLFISSILIVLKNVWFHQLFFFLPEFIDVIIRSFFLLIKWWTTLIGIPMLINLGYHFTMNKSQLLAVFNFYIYI